MTAHNLNSGVFPRSGSRAVIDRATAKRKYSGFEFLFMWRQITRLLAHPLLAGTNGGRGIVSIIAPSGMMKLNHMIAVIGSDRFGELHRTDAAPVADRGLLKTGYAARLAVVRNGYIKCNR